MINEKIRLIGIILSSIFLILIPSIWFLKYLNSIEKKNLIVSKNNIYKINHLGIIMDGNRRWAKLKNISLEDSYFKGGEKLQDVILFCIKNNINILTVYALTLDNLRKRSESEINAIFSIISSYLEDKLTWFLEKKIKVNAIGDLSFIPTEIKNKIEVFCEKTKNNSVLNLNILFAYDYLNDIEYGVKSIIDDFKNKKITEDEINEFTILSHMRSKDIPPIDLVIRTGNSERISGFVPLQSAYSEIIYLSCMWPDLKINDLDEIIKDFSLKTRNFGK